MRALEEQRHREEAERAGAPTADVMEDEPGAAPAKVALVDETSSPTAGRRFTRSR